MILLKALYFALPIYAANMAPVLVAKVPFLAAPIDGGLTYKGKPLLGKNKTWRGLLFGVLFALITIFIQGEMFSHQFAQQLSSLDYRSLNLILIGFLMGFGALFGDAFKSFIKRRIGKKSGSAWPPFDQIDFILGSLVFTAYFVWPGWGIWVSLFLVTPFLHWATNVLAYKIGLKNVPW